jgi:hypothetical protein
MVLYFLTLICTLFSRQKSFDFFSVVGSVEDLHHCDQDPTFNFDAADPDPDSSFLIKAQNLQEVLK